MSRENLAAPHQDRRRVWAGVLLACLLLAGCDGSAPSAVVETQTATPTATATVVPTPTTGPTATPATGTARPTGTPVASGGTTTVGGTTAEQGATLIEQAIGYVRTYAIQSPTAADLYAAAYDGAADFARASGRTPEAQRPTFADDADDPARFRAAYLALAGEPPALAGSPFAYAAIRAVTARVGDCNTVFLDPEEYRQRQAAEAGTASYAGVGISVREKTSLPLITTVYPGTPAERGGVRPGDVILAIDGKEVAGLAPDRIASLVRGPEGTTVTLLVRRPGAQGPRTFTLTRARVAIPTLVSRVVAGPGGTKVGYLRLYAFATDADAELGRALVSFEAQGAATWVLDLRDNSGGLYDVLGRVAGRFIPGGSRSATRCGLPDGSR